MTLTPTTLLEAVNRLLATISHSPVSSLDGIQGQADAGVAISTLTEVSRDVQTHGYNFNTEFNYPLVPDVNGEIILPSDCLEVRTTGDSASLGLVRRGSKLYDRTEHTYVINKTVYVELVRFLDFETLPESARTYIMVRATRLFANKILGDEYIENFTEKDEYIAKANLMNKEAENAGYNILTSNTWTLNIWDR
jgi:hypothetical protein